MEDLGERLTWDDVSALALTAAPWDPLPRAQNPDEWHWYIPGFDLLVTLVEASLNNNVLTGNQSGAKRKDFVKPAKRPWGAGEKEEKILKGDTMPINMLDDFMASRLA